MGMDTFGNPKEEKEIFPVLFFVGGGESSLHMCNDNNLKRM